MKTLHSFNSLDEFEILPVASSSKNCLGVGSFGQVKLALARKTNQKYALKIVNLKELECDAEIQSIKREIKVHSKLNHPYIIKMFDNFKNGNVIVMVLEYAENGNLYNFLKKKKRFSESEAFVFFSQTVKAIQYLHENDILHRDIKPENLLLDKNFHIKVCDFGWCTEDIKRKRTTFCGTYEYMSPEVVFKKPYSENIDVWSLGILIYELTVGSSPFKAKNLQEITQRLKNHKELYFPDFISSDLKDLISGILKMDPDQRISLKQIIDHKWWKKNQAKTGYEEIPNLNSKTKSETSTLKKNEKKKIFQDTKNAINNAINIDPNEQKFIVSPKKTIESFASRVRKPIFFEKKTSLDNELVESSLYFNKTEHGKFRDSGNFVGMNSSFLTKTHTDISVFKSIDIKRTKIFLNKGENEENPGKILKTMENLMSQINITHDNKNFKPQHIKNSSIVPVKYNCKDEDKGKKMEIKRPKRFLFENIKYQSRKENI